MPTLVHGLNIREIKVADSISGDNFATGSRTDVLTAHAQTVSSQKSPKNDVQRQKWPCLYRNMGALNSNITSDFKPLDRLRVRLNVILL